MMQVPALRALADQQAALVKSLPEKGAVGGDRRARVRRFRRRCQGGRPDMGRAVLEDAETVGAGQLAVRAQAEKKPGARLN